MFLLTFLACKRGVRVQVVCRGCLYDHHHQQLLSRHRHHCTPIEWPQALRQYMWSDSTLHNNCCLHNLQGITHNLFDKYFPIESILG